MEYDTVIFDLDGTLLESTAEHLEWLYTAVEEVLEDFEVDSTQLSHRELQILAGIEGYESFEEKCSELGIDDEEFWFHVSHARARGKLELLEQDLLELVDGARETLEFLRKNEASLAIVSNAPDPTVDEVVRFFDLDSLMDFFRGVTDLEDLKKRKPHSFHLELAARELKGEDVLYVGDSRIDAAAAEKIGVDSAVIGGSGNATFKLEEITDLKNIFRI